jgi:hypothetical protein
MIEVKTNMVSRKVGHQSFAEKRGPYSRSRKTFMEPPRELKNLHISVLNVGARVLRCFALILVDVLYKR